MIPFDLNTKHISHHRAITERACPAASIAASYAVTDADERTNTTGQTMKREL
ncbi:MAG: hypothetical protein RRB22_01895 [Gammaproteobacteria bacterium]|nr:hypothetical protein [Gammaproteobacteria bacterium]